MVEVSKRIINKNPEQFLKPLDVVWVEKESFGVSFYHIGVYLGKNNVCHFSSRGKSRESNKSIITDWNFFVEGSTSDAFAYRSIVPFKHYELIAKQIDWANENNYDEGRYCLPNNNCEYHANGFVFGISYSQQVKERKPWFWPKRCDFCESCKSGKVNRGRSSAINLNSEISSTNGGLRNKTGHWYKEIKENYEAKILIEKNNCNIM
jgi:hypothetical protein